MSTLTTVVNTLNSEATLEMCLKSVKDLGEIVVVDMHSDDKTVQIAQRFTSKIFTHERTGFVEPARNFAISKAETEWVLVLDSDEEIPDSLKKKIREITQKPGEITHAYFPRKNMIFGTWMQHTGWWPDEKMRLFKKGTVTWKNEIHSEPECLGESYHLAEEEKLAIVHHHYQTVSDWVLRMDRYTTVQAKEIAESKYEYDWRDLIRKPLSEFLTRFFIWEGWKDGANGFALSLMQALSWVIVYMKVKEIRKIANKKGDREFLQEVGDELDNMENELGHYLEKLGLQSQLKRWVQKVLS
jgi:glycosyltransferase involved in cell wall biosynthesis